MFKLEPRKSEKIMEARSRLNHSLCASPSAPLAFCMSRYERDKTELRSRFYFSLKLIAPATVNSN